jgi:hypothetical protein
MTIARLGKTIKEALEAPISKMPLRRHKDDDYWDEVNILAGQVVFGSSVVPRYKTSGLSGDEWRIGARLVVKVRGEEVVTHDFHRMNGLLTYAPGFIYAERERVPLSEGPARLVAKRKGVVLVERDFPSFGDAAMGAFWHIVTANEGAEGVVWHHLTNAEERAHCQQVGCAEPPVNTFHLKKILIGDHPPETFAAPRYDFEGQFVWYCARHTRRGDCGYEDADENLELVEGTGVAREHAEDESPSALVGAIEVDLSDDGDR